MSYSIEVCFRVTIPILVLKTIALGTGFEPTFCLDE
jgi:hypothetical protein